MLWQSGKHTRVQPKIAFAFHDSKGVARLSRVRTYNKCDTGVRAKILGARQSSKRHQRQTYCSKTGRCACLVISNRASATAFVNGSKFTARNAAGNTHSRSAHLARKFRLSTSRLPEKTEVQGPEIPSFCQ